MLNSFNWIYLLIKQCSLPFKLLLKIWWKNNFYKSCYFYEKYQFCINYDTLLYVIQSWRRAAEQVLYSLDVGTGHLIIYGANRSFHNNILGGVLLVALLDTVCAVAATIVVFATANIEASKFHIEFNLVFKSGKPSQFLR